MTARTVVRKVGGVDHNLEKGLEVRFGLSHDRGLPSTNVGV
jgi:hypothetical protein